MVEKSHRNGWFCIHIFYKIHWNKWNLLSTRKQKEIILEFLNYFYSLTKLDKDKNDRLLFNILGSKGDFGLMIFREKMVDLNKIENHIYKLSIGKFLYESGTYVSIAEDSQYMNVKKMKKINADKYKKRKLFPEIPLDDYICFYPMSKIKSCKINWYTLSLKKRRKMMRAHGLIGRKYFGKIKQIVTGSTGIDDYEWGVSLFSNQPEEFKNIVYEMRFSKVSNTYSQFPYFIVGKNLKKSEEFFDFMMLKGE